MPSSARNVITVKKNKSKLRYCSKLKLGLIFHPFRGIAIQNVSVFISYYNHTTFFVRLQEKNERFIATFIYFSRKSFHFFLSAKLKFFLAGLFSDISQNSAVHVEDMTIHGIRGIRCQKYRRSLQFLCFKPSVGRGLCTDKLIEGVS